MEQEIARLRVVRHFDDARKVQISSTSEPTFFVEFAYCSPLRADIRSALITHQKRSLIQEQYLPTMVLDPVDQPGPEGRHFRNSKETKQT